MLGWAESSAILKFQYILSIQKITPTKFHESICKMYNEFDYVGQNWDENVIEFLQLFIPSRPIIPFKIKGNRKQ